MKTTKMRRNFNKNQKQQILLELKRSQGLSVGQLCTFVKLSYMGVKQHCVALQKQGYLDTWRRPKGMGRPEKVYRLTPQAQELFPSDSTEFTCSILRSVESVYGQVAPEKILHQIYQEQTQSLRKELQGATFEERVRSLAGLREDRGYMAEYYFCPETSRHQLIEYNSPVLQIGDLYPILFDLEKQMLEELLDATTTRDTERVAGLYRCTFSFEPHR